MEPNETQWKEKMRSKYAPEIEKASKYDHDAAREEAEHEWSATLESEGKLPQSWTDK